MEKGYIYYLLIITVLLAVSENRILRKSYKYTITLISIILLGQRWAMGIDFYNYLYYYIFSYKVEYGYTLIQNFFSNNNIYFGLIIFLSYLTTTVISIYLLTRYIKSNLGILIFYISEYHIMSVNPIRSYIAIVFFNLSVYLYLKNKKIKSFILLVLGTLFHKSIIMIIPIFTILKKKIKISKIFLLIFLLIVPFINLRTIINYTPYGRLYVGTEYDRGASLLNYLKYFATIILYLYTRLVIKIEKNKIIERLFYFYLLIYGLSLNMAIIHRIAYFLKLYEIIYFSQIFDYKNLNYKIIFSKVIVIAFFLCIYFGAAYKDLGVIFSYKYERIKLYNTKTKDEYLKEIYDYKNVFEEKNRGE